MEKLTWFLPEGVAGTFSLFDDGITFSIYASGLHIASRQTTPLLLVL